ncbi:hypothetical protein [Gracilinema caldarium]|uniref:hypothetical protein n=1 Tax=Gracilinema caldarium TaxID=215591 RepID=UPI0026F062DD|nr:hypothetical protein [Gracilinema caldarium]
MKLNRTSLLWIIASIGVAMILYAVAKQFIGFTVDPALEKTFFDFIVIGALGILLYNRKLARDEAAAALEKQQNPAPDKTET